MPDFHEVTAAWDTAHANDIHPLRRVNVSEYWKSGTYQAFDAAQWLPESGTVMDFGCGEGRLSIPLARMGYHVVAVDASKTMLARLAANAPDFVEGRIRIVHSDGLDLAMMEPVDAVVCRAVLIHHAHSDVELLVQAFADVIKQDGYLIADWPLGEHYERQFWTDVTTWDAGHRLQVGNDAGFELIDDDTPTVWKRR